MPEKKKEKEEKKVKLSWKEKRQKKKEDKVRFIFLDYLFESNFFLMIIFYFLFFVD